MKLSEVERVAKALFKIRALPFGSSMKTYRCAAAVAVIAILSGVEVGGVDMSKKLIERVARVLARAEGEPYRPFAEIYLAMAKAAIRALRSGEKRSRDTEIWKRAADEFKHCKSCIHCRIAGAKFRAFAEGRFWKGIDLRRERAGNPARDLDLTAREGR